MLCVAGEKLAFKSRIYLQVEGDSPHAVKDADEIVS